MCAKNISSGFTLVELLIVIVVIGILATVSIVAYNGVSRRAQESALKLALRNTTSKLSNDNVLAGVYPASLVDADEGRGISAQNGIELEYTYSASDNTYCLTARSANNAIPPMYVSSSNSTPQTGACSGHGLTGNLVINGDGSNGNTNFTPLVYDASNPPPEAKGSFVSPNGAYQFYFSNQDIEVNPSKRYKLSGWGRQQTSGITTSRWYFGLSPRDAYGNQISPYNYFFRPGTTTTLSQPLNTGDTIVHLTNLTTAWYDLPGSAVHFRSFIFWGYTDPSGKLWPPETYSRNTVYGDIYNGGAGAINLTNKTISLNKPWPGASYPAGHPVSNGGAGATYMYSAASSALLANTWQQWTSPVITGTVTPGLNSATTNFPPATKYVRIAIGANHGSPPATSRTSVGGIRFYEVE